MGLKALPWGFRLLGRGKKRGLEGRRQQRLVKRMPFEHTCRISILSSLVFAQIEPFITEHSPVIFRPSFVVVHFSDSAVDRWVIALRHHFRQPVSEN